MHVVDVEEEEKGLILVTPQPTLRRVHLGASVSDMTVQTPKDQVVNQPGQPRQAKVQWMGVVVVGLKALVKTPEGPHERVGVAAYEGGGSVAAALHALRQRGVRAVEATVAMQRAVGQGIEAREHRGVRRKCPVGLREGILEEQPLGREGIEVASLDKMKAVGKVDEVDAATLEALRTLGYAE